MYCDTHFHLMDECFKDKNLILDNAKKNGINCFILGGSNKEDNFFNINFANNNNSVFVSVGYHPEVCDDIYDEDILFLENLIINNKDKVVAIGEIGLDYHYGKDNIDKQKDLFIKQLKLAKKYDLPVVIHSRDAFLDTYTILKDLDINNGVIHCFSDSLEVALKYIDLGFYLGIGGVVTFKNCKLINVLKEIPLNRILFETDSPYLSPNRGEINEPKNILLIANYISDNLNISLDELSEIVFNNSIKLFDLKL